MPYRRSGTRYSRRAPRRSTFWIRNQYTLGTQTQDASFDMLRDDLVALGRNGEVINPNATPINDLVPPGCTVMRLRGHVIAEMGGRQLGNNITYGFIVDEPEADNLNPVRHNIYDDRSTSDWMWWDTVLQAGPETVETTGTYLMYDRFDVRAKRRLREASDSLLLYWQASEPISELHLTYSVLLARP